MMLKKLCYHQWHIHRYSKSFFIMFINQLNAGNIVIQRNANDVLNEKVAV